MKNFLTVFFMACFLAACGSTVPLEDVPVNDIAAKSVSDIGAESGVNGSGAKGGSVTAVDLGKGSTSASQPNESRVVYFDYDSYVIKPDFQAVIEVHANFVKAQPNRKVAIEGHTDETGGREYNLALGQKRADAVRNALSILGVSQTQMEAVSFGKEKPAVAGNDEAAFSKNRRVEIRYQ